ncbi:MAG: phosphoserine phosphatase SerB [Pseudomonadota bacterium]
MSHVLSLIAGSQKSPLQTKHINAACKLMPKLGVELDTGQWLAEKISWQVEFDRKPVEVLAAVRKAAARWPVDVNIVPAATQRKKLLIADMDSTMIEQECIDELADAAGAGEAVKAITARAMNGELDFEDALRERVAALKHLPSGVIGEVISTRISFMAGGRDLIATMRQNSAYCALISGGFTHFTAYVGAELGFHEHQANELIIQDNLLTGEVASPILGRDAKVAALQRITGRFGFSMDEAMAVGDGANDIPMLQTAGIGVALHAKPAVKQEVDIQIDHGDLTALLYLQGFTRDEFARHH